MQRKWRIAAHDADRIDALRQAAGLPAIVAQLLISRGVYDPAVARSFLDPKLTQLRDPSELPGGRLRGRGRSDRRAVSVLQGRGR